jgi:hypothetical protein
MKVNEDKKDGIVFSGPYYGPVAMVEREANKAAKDLSNQAKSGAVISKIFPIENGQQFGEAMVQAKPIFDRIKCDMLEARELMDRPIRKKKK